MATLKDNSGNTASVAKFGGFSSIRSKTASKFVPTATWSVTDVSVRLNEDTGAPLGNVRVGIFTDDGAGKPSSTQVGGYATITAGEISTGGGFQDFTKTLASPASLTFNVTYWLVFDVSASESDSAYYSSRAITTAGAGNGAQYNEPSVGAWTTNTDDLYYILTGTATISFVPNVLII